MGNNAVEAEGLVKRFDSVVALHGVDIVVPEATVLGLLGPNGAGKTTPIRARLPAGGLTAAGTCRYGGPVRFRLIPREGSFYPLFRQAATNLLEAARRLDEEMTDFFDLQAKHKGIVECESLGDEITRSLLRKLYSTYVTPFDREDILVLAQTIDDVLDEIQAVSDLVVLHNIVEPLPEMRELTGILVRAAEEAVLLIDRLETLKGTEPHLQAIDALESEADAAYRRTVARLFSGDYKPRDILRWKDVVEALEQSVNSIEDMANVVESIVLKHA